MNISLESDGVHIRTDSIGNKVMIQQGINNSLTLAENTGTSTFLTPFIHPTPTTSANDTQSATTEYVRTYIQTLNLVDNPITDQASAIFGIKASTCSLDCRLINYGSPLVITDAVFTAVYLTAGMQFKKYNIIAGKSGIPVPLRFAIFGPDWNYVSNSDTASYNSISATPTGGLLTSTLTNTVTITTTGVHYIFYQSNATVAVNSYYAGIATSSSTFQSNRITNSWRTSGTLSSNGPFRSFYISGTSGITPSTYGNIGSKTITGWLGRINFIFLSI